MGLGTAPGHPAPSAGHCVQTGRDAGAKRQKPAMCWAPGHGTDHQGFVQLGWHGTMRGDSPWWGRSCSFLL